MGLYRGVKMATRSTIIISNTDIPKNIREAKKTKTLLKCLGKKSEYEVGYIFKMYDSYDFDFIKDIANNQNFQYYWQYGDIQSLISIFMVLLTLKSNEKMTKEVKDEMNIDMYLHRNHISNGYYVDSEYIFWFDNRNKKLNIYKTVWTDIDKDYWDIESLILLESIDLPLKNIELYKWGY